MRRSKADRTAALKRSAGAWQDREFSGADYVDAIRGNLDAELLTTNVRHFPMFPKLVRPY